MKKIRRQTVKQTKRFNRKAYKNPDGLKTTARINFNKRGKKQRHTRVYIFKENGEYIRVHRFDKLKKYKPVYTPLFGRCAAKYIFESMLF